MRNIDQKIYQGVDGDLVDGPPCLAEISKISNKDGFDGKDRFMYNYHTFNSRSTIFINDFRFIH